MHIYICQLCDIVGGRNVRLDASSRHTAILVFYSLSVKIAVVGRDTEIRLHEAGNEPIFYFAQGKLLTGSGRDYDTFSTRDDEWCVFGL